MLEIPRSMAASGWKLGGGLFMALVAGALATSSSFDNEPWSAVLVTAMVALPAALLIVSQIWILVRRPLGLRATEAGVWFGGGPIIAWSDVESTCEATLTAEQQYQTIFPKLGGVALAFRRKRAVLRLPPYCWLTSMTIGTVRVSTLKSPLSPGAIAAQLEQLRFAACSHEDGVLPGAIRPPNARIVQR